ncbi:adenosylcobinamide-GDP ribazoletransferase [Xenorhabdus hominickii]|uniref:Adenosylcobinamide-GDP ribazoletransferase n=1 Tax=Xenorhabdus hominickii TaxID=351679 RepID=A0A2G0Q054_XENHO|nr:adenosylcobinamide-GDP ribazoletransferase [Xenorhabdus hominickii]AOM42748.1 adenosylcobinamide-GDP ribazoletransferase [Xenorhabdus hominickii]PHM52597.1 cobalamin synthase [Xenorhabdus hominickii]
MRLNLFWVTMQFMTRLPIPEKWARGVHFRQYWRGVPNFPLIGLIVGGLAGLIFISISQFGGGVYIGAIGYVLALALLTGGLHLDGVANTCNDLFTAHKHKREKMREMIRDNRLGTYGSLGLIFCISLKTLAVFELSYYPPLHLLALLTCAPIVGRAAVVLLMYGQRYAHEDMGMGSYYIGQVTSSSTILTLLGGSVLVMALGNWQGLSAMMMTFLVIYGLAFYFNYRLGGQTDGTLGASIEAGEVIFLLAMIWQ